MAGPVSLGSVPAFSSNFISLSQINARSQAPHGSVPARSQALGQGGDGPRSPQALPKRQLRVSCCRPGTLSAAPGRGGCQRCDAQDFVWGDRCWGGLTEAGTHQPQQGAPPGALKERGWSPLPPRVLGLALSPRAVPRPRCQELPVPGSWQLDVCAPRRGIAKGTSLARSSQTHVHWQRLFPCEQAWM